MRRATLFALALQAMGASGAAHAFCDELDFRFQALKLARGISGELIAKPAEISYTRPAEGEATANVSAAIFGAAGLHCSATSTTEFTGGVAHYRNTASAATQNTVLAGVAADGLLAQYLMHHFDLQHKNDRVAGSRGGVASFALYPVIEGVLNHRVGRWGESVLAVGIQHERVSSVDADTAAAVRAAGLTPTGSATRWTLEAGLSFALDRFAVSGSILGWRDIHRDGPFDRDDRTRTYRTFGVSYALDEAKTVRLAIERVEGTHPIEGLFNEKYTQVVLKLKPSLLWDRK